MTQIIDITGNDNILMSNSYKENIKLLSGDSVIIRYEKMKLPIIITKLQSKTYLISTRNKIDGNAVGDPFNLIFATNPRGPIALKFLNKTRIYSANELMPMLLKFLKCMRFTEITLCDEAKIEFRGGLYFYLSPLTLLQKGIYFYEKYGFIPAPMYSGAYYYFNGHTYKLSIRKLYCIVNEIIPIIYRCFINKIMEFFRKVQSDKIILNERGQQNKKNTKKTKECAGYIISSCEDLPRINEFINIRKVLKLWAEGEREKETNNHIYHFFSIFRLIHDLLIKLPCISDINDGRRIYNWYCEIIVEYIDSIDNSHKMVYHYPKNQL